jgi:hypothetical protein
MRSPEMQKAWDAVVARPCQCIQCAECRGTGHIYFSFGGYAHGRYLGSHRCDDLDEMESCDTCGGSGITETCERCYELEELDAMEQEAEERESRQ